MSESFVLMYHRVCERDDRTRCWFERGTAVTPSAFDRQLAWLTERFEVVPLDALVEPPTPSARPRVALTFDDGYMDTLAVVAPICSRHGVTATCFAPAGPALTGTPLWFDAWYELVATGLGRPDWPRLLEALGLYPGLDLKSCVVGPPKVQLGALPPETRHDVIVRLSHALARSVPRALQLDIGGLRRLRALGWRIGGHGIEHARLADADPGTVEHELAGSRRLLAAVGEIGPLHFAYPDGAWNATVVDAVARVGFALACTTDRGAWTSSTHRLRIPRLFCRGDSPTPHHLLASMGGAPE